MHSLYFGPPTPLMVASDLLLVCSIAVIPGAIGVGLAAIKRGERSAKLVMLFGAAIPVVLLGYGLIGDWDTVFADSKDEFTPYTIHSLVRPTIVFTLVITGLWLVVGWLALSLGVRVRRRMHR